MWEAVLRARTIVTVVLLLFVGVSVVYLIAGKRPHARSGSEQTQSVDRQAARAERAKAPKVIVYYFHGNARCRTCRTIEQYSREAVEDAFADDLASGVVLWRVLNVQEPGNEHFISDYELITRSVVLVRPGAEGADSWKDLKEVWELVGDKEAFQAYVRDNVRAFLGEPR